MKHLLLLLGAPNDEKGNLSQIALDRIRCGLDIYNMNDEVTFLCTGGFGPQFNTTQHPHAHYTKQHLIDKGVRKEDILESVPSANTVEDFRLSKPIIERIAPKQLIIITSDFHMPRVKIFHDIILNYPRTLFIPAFSTLSPEELTHLQYHEARAIQKLKDNKYVLY